MIKYSDIGEREAYINSQFKVQSIMSGKAMQYEIASGGHTIVIVRNREELMHACCLIPIFHLYRPRSKIENGITHNMQVFPPQVNHNNP